MCDASRTVVRAPICLLGKWAGSPFHLAMLTNGKNGEKNGVASKFWILLKNLPAFGGRKQWSVREMEV